MPTSGILPITPKLGFFPLAKTMFNPGQAARFRPVYSDGASATWDNVTKLLTCAGTPCEGGSVGKPMHIWTDPLVNEGWATVEACSNGAYSLPTLDVPNGALYIFSIGTLFPCWIGSLFGQLFLFYGTSKAYGVRYGALWTTVDPWAIQWDPDIIHFDGWPD